MPIRKKVGAFADEVLEFALAVVKHWKLAATGSVILGVGWTSYSLLTGKTPTFVPYLWALVSMLPAAVFLAWREEHTDRLATENRITQPDLTQVLTNQLRLSNDVAKLKPPREIGNEEFQRIASRADAWLAYPDTHQYRRRLLILYTPTAHDAIGYANQIRAAFDAGRIYSDEVQAFVWGLGARLDEETNEHNKIFGLIHRLNVTVYGTDTQSHGGQPLQDVAVDALRLGGVDVTIGRHPSQVGGQIAIIVGSGELLSSSTPEV